MTERLYYQDSYTHTFEASIADRIRVQGRPALILDKTYFYPTSGGQPHDTGTINDVRVVDVFAREGDQAVIHVLESSVDAGFATCMIDWGRRFDHMQHHTGQHILTRAFEQIADARTISFHMSDDSITIDLNVGVNQLTPEIIEKVETRVNRLIHQNRPVKTEIVDPNTIADVRIRKMPEHLLTEGLRVVEVMDFDRTACGGTHVSRTSEIGMLKIIRVEKRGETSRVEFRCGLRALDDYRMKNDIIGELVGLLTCHPQETVKAVQRLQDDLKESRRELRALKDDLLDGEAEQLLSTAQDINDIRIIAAAYDGRNKNDLQGIASRLATIEHTIILLATAGTSSHFVFARHGDLDLDMNQLLQHAFGELGDGRGGGRPDMAQGGGIPATYEQITIALDAVIQSLS